MAHLLLWCVICCNFLWYSSNCRLWHYCRPLRSCPAGAKTHAQPTWEGEAGWRASRPVHCCSRSGWYWLNARQSEGLVSLLWAFTEVRWSCSCVGTSPLEKQSKLSVRSPGYLHQTRAIAAELLRTHNGKNNCQAVFVLFGGCNCLKANPGDAVWLQ